MRIRALLFAGLLFALGLVAAPANAAATNQISGTANFGECPPPPDGFEDFVDYPPIVMDGEGSLDGCWYTNVLTPEPFATTPGGVYLESGEEVFVGSLNGVQGTFTTTYKFEAKFTLPLPNLDALEIKGRCQHKIVSGTGGFAGASGRVDFKDIINGTSVTYEYRGHISLATAA
jgi:hypothetical protein